MAMRTFRIFRGDDRATGEMREYTIDCGEGMVVLDAVHRIQGQEAPDLACRWNCKAGKCGSCGADINGQPKLMCMTRLSDYPEDMTLTITPMRAFPVLRDLATDVSTSFANNRALPYFQPRKPDFECGEFRMLQWEVERPQEFRKCIECFLCQNTCHVLRTHEKHDEFIGPAFFVRASVYEMHPADEGDRAAHVKGPGGLGYCNITRCCTEACPESIRITDNAIIPLKERVADRCHDPLRWLLRKITGKG